MEEAAVKDPHSGRDYLIWRKGQRRMTQSEYEDLTRVCATVEPKSGEYYVHVDVWRGPSASVIRNLARKRYRGCYVQFGRAF